MRGTRILRWSRRGDDTVEVYKCICNSVSAKSENEEVVVLMDKDQSDDHKKTGRSHPNS